VPEARCPRRMRDMTSIRPQGVTAPTDSAGAGQRPRLAVLISGRGSNLRALVGALGHGQEGSPHWLVVSNEPEAAGLAWAQAQGIDTALVCHRDFATRAAFDEVLLTQIRAFGPDLVVLAGFMRILTPGFCEALAGKVINIHPALLPAFTGLDTHARALAAGVRLHGATVHAVTAALDHGPILAQGVVPVLVEDTAESLAARVLEIEHQLYPQAVAAVLSGAVVWQEGCWHWTASTGAAHGFRLGPHHGHGLGAGRRFTPVVVHPLLCPQEP
jgi:phosphoribosylglycinamide formyltransferase 1